ncbi:hypothetical protein FQN50_006311 [Emmonsiellopsis sp. PD_5]|nr:hypothetical protein FQN50_006311 [Emmonsiellopsis sp. PD_5]
MSPSLEVSSVTSPIVVFPKASSQYGYAFLSNMSLAHFTYFLSMKIPMASESTRAHAFSPAKFTTSFKH